MIQCRMISRDAPACHCLAPRGAGVETQIYRLSWDYWAILRIRPTTAIAEASTVHPDERPLPLPHFPYLLSFPRSLPPLPERSRTDDMVRLTRIRLPYGA